MSSYAHTPGPWRLDFEKHYSGAEGFRVAKTRCQSYAIYAGRKCIAAVITAWRASDPQSVADGTAQGYRWHSGYSETPADGGVCYPWMTHRECQAEAKAKGAFARFEMPVGRVAKIEA